MASDNGKTGDLSGCFAWAGIIVVLALCLLMVAGEIARAVTWIKWAFT